MSAVVVSHRPVALLVNPNAAGGRALRLLPRIEERLRDLGVGVRSHVTRSLEHAADLARAAAAEGLVCVSFGGDGLAGAIAGALRGVPGAALGVLPGGRGNDFARAVGLPLDRLEACAVIARGHARPVDLGEAGTRTLVTIASLGVESEVNRLAAAAANGSSYGAGMRLAPAARLDDGTLDVVLIARLSRPGFLLALPSVFLGAHLRLPTVTVVPARAARVESDPLTVWADGEAHGPLPMTVRAVPAALEVLVR